MEKLCSLGEPAEQIRKNAEALDFDPNSIVFLDLSPTQILRRGADLRYLQ